MTKVKSRISRVLVIAPLSALLGIGVLAVPANAATSSDGNIYLGAHDYGSGAVITCDLSGAGTSVLPYDVNSAVQLAEVSDCNSAAAGAYEHYKLSANIDLTPLSKGIGDASQATGDGWNTTDTGGASTGGWVPLGDYGDDSTVFANTKFFGDFNGAGFTISNLKIDRSSEQYLGLFGQVRNSYIHNLTLTNNQIDAGYRYIGGLAGSAEYSNFDKIWLTSGTIKVFSSYAGGLIGSLNNSNMTNINVAASIENSNTATVIYLGGIVGYTYYSNLTHVNFNGDVLGDSSTGDFYGSYVGGIYGVGSGVITDVKVTANVTGSSYTGGVIGEASDGLANHVSFEGSVTASAGSITRAVDSVGGLIGYLDYGDITNAVGKISVYANLTGTDTNQGRYIGGVAGHVSESSNVNAVKITGNVAAKNATGVGGLIGISDDGVALNSSSYKGTVSTTTGSNIGGLIGLAETGTQIMRSSVEAKSYVSSDSTEVGGLIGSASEGVSVLDCYNRANVTGSNNVAGIVGQVTTGSFAVKNAYTTGKVTATLVSPQADAFAFVDSYKATDNSNAYNKTTTSRATSGSGVRGYTTTQMKDKATFNKIGWKLNTASSPWTINSAVNDGYPNLSGAPAPALVANVKLGEVAFAPGSTRLSIKAKKDLRAIASSYKAAGFTKLTITVYTMSSQTRPLNRAKVIAAYLKKHGVTVTIINQAQMTESKKLNRKARIYGSVS
jgi:outer membrane protein OmpA-like peptidoglycan-associated protein